MKKWIMSIFFVLLIPTLAIYAQEELPDTDGDFVPDQFDSCPAEAGLPQNSGCAAGIIADVDADGIPDQTDFCFDQPGTSEFLGCTAETLPNTDYDLDTVIDLMDACVDVAGDVANVGCPADVVPDSDRDSVPDSADQCPRLPGDPASGGCINDPDGDLLPSEYDGCPDQPGSSMNYGCPEGATPPDSDGDGLPDLGDSCPAETGSMEAGGCPDADVDSIPDQFDMCPQEVGVTDLSGCPEITQATLPEGRTPITAENAPRLAELAQLRVGAYQASLINPSNQFALQTGSGVLLYDISTATIAPRVLESTGGITAYSPAANAAALVNYNVDGFGAPTVELWNTADSTMRLTIPQEHTNLNAMAVSEDGTLLATGHGTYYTAEGQEIQDNVVRLWNTADGSLIGTLQHSEPVYKVLISPNGSRLVTQTDTTMNVWDVTAQSALGTLQGSFSPVFLGDSIKFSPDSTRIATASTDGSVILWDSTTLAEVARFPVFDGAAGQMVSALAFNADGTLIAAGGGEPFSSDPTTTFYPVHVLNAADGTILTTLNGHGIMVMSLGFSADNTLLITVSGDRTVRFWGVTQ